MDKQVKNDIKYLSQKTLNEDFKKPFSSFYKKGAMNSIFLTPGIRKCLTRVYGKGITRTDIRN